MKQFRFILTMVLAIGFLPVAAQEEEDHLWPETGILEAFDFSFEYHSKIRKLLFDGLSDSPEIQLAIIPSFTPEEVLNVEFDKKTESYYMNYHICKENIWFHHNWEEIKVQKYRKKINTASAKLLKSLFIEAIYGTRHPASTKYPTRVTVRNDGTNYYFSVENYGKRSGRTWSPGKESKMGRLVAIGQELTELVKNDDEIINFDDSLITKIENLKKELE